MRHGRHRVRFARLSPAGAASGPPGCTLLSNQWLAGHPAHGRALARMLGVLDLNLSAVKGRPARVAATALVVLVLAVGFCAFDGGHDGSGHHAMPPDLCAGLLVASATILMLVGPVPGGWLVVEGRPVARAITTRLLEPPPKSSRA